MATFVMIHGGMTGGNSWKKVKESLEANNHKVFTPTLSGLADRNHLAHPNVDLQTHIQDVLNLIAAENLEEIILVGHSYSGMVITGVASRVPLKIKKVIYLAAVVPFTGESMFDAVGPSISNSLYNSAHNNNGWQVPAAAAESYGITQPEDVEWYNSMATAHPIKCFTQALPFNDTTVEPLNKVYISCSQDELLTPMIERAESLNIACKQINAAHFAMITSPEAVVKVLLEESSFLL